MGKGLVESDGVDIDAVGEWREAGLLTGGFFVVAKLDEAAGFADFGEDGEAGFGVGAELAGVVVAGGSVGFLDFLPEGAVEITEHLDAFEFVIGDLVKVLFDVGGELIVDDVGKVLGEEASDELASGGGDEFAFVGAGFLGGSSLLNATICESEFNDGARLAFGGSLLDVAAGLDGGEDGSVGGGAADAEFFEFFD